MLWDARELEDGAVIEADLAIVGAGAAGIAIARTFIGTPIRVALIESGGLRFDPDTQDLYKGHNAGLPYFELHATRFRYFGGSTFHWAGRARPMDPIDFEERSWVPHSGWPISYDEFVAYVEPAQEVLQMGPARYDPAFWGIDEDKLLPIDPTLLRNLVWQFSPTHFGEAYREELQRAANVDVLLHANVVDIATDAHARHVEALRIATLGGPRLSVRARDYVLACGGLENPRLLLASRSVRPEGLGNRHDVVGRYFMEHPHVDTGQLVLDRRVDDRLYARGFERQGTRVMAHLGLAPELQRKAELLHWQAHLKPNRIGVTGFAAFRRALHAALRRRWTYELSWDLFRAVRHIDDTIAGVLDRLRVREYHARGCLYIGSHVEQAPNPESRVRLDDGERDALGMPRIRLEWRLTELERRTLEVVHQTLGRELERTGCGQLTLAPWLEDPEGGWPSNIRGGHHHMGTTRMSDDPRKGVVDRDCCVHGMANLYVAGSSVFPTSSCVNPTPTLVALALRLGEHLRERASRATFEATVAAS